MENTIFVAIGCALSSFASIVSKFDNSGKTNTSYNEVPLDTDTMSAQ